MKKIYLMALSIMATSAFAQKPLTFKGQNESRQATKIQEKNSSTACVHNFWSKY